MADVGAGGAVATDGDHMTGVVVGLPDGARTVTLPDFKLESGETLTAPTIAYSTYGTLNSEGTNAIVVGHSLTSSSQVHDWWPHVLGVGPEFALDTTRFFVVCCNYFCSVYGSASPLSVNAATGRRYAADFPEIVTIRDNVRAQKMVLDGLGVKHCVLAVGGSMGAMLCLEWGLMYPAFVGRVGCIAGCARHTDWAIALGKVERQAIFNDPRWKDGHYELSQPPDEGLSVARMMAMLSYRTPSSITDRFQRSLQPGAAVEHTDPDAPSPVPPPAEGEAAVPDTVSVPRTAPLYAVESYLNHQGKKFAKRFDPLCYVRLTKTLDTHDVGRGRGDWRTALGSITQPTLVVGVASDILYPVVLQEELSNAIPDSVMSIIDSPHGHDGFLIELLLLNDTIKRWWKGDLPDSRLPKATAGGEGAREGGAGAGSGGEAPLMGSLMARALTIKAAEDSVKRGAVLPTGTPPPPS